MSFRDFTQALETRLTELVDSPPVAWPNTKYDPVIGTLYLRATDIPASSSTTTMDYSEEQVGIYQVDVVAPSDKGSGAALDMAEQIADHFAAQRKLTANSTDVYIRSISRAQGFRDGAWYVVPVSITYYGHITR